MGKPVKTPELLISIVIFFSLDPLKMLVVSVIKVRYLLPGIKNSKFHQIWLLFQDAIVQNGRSWKAPLEII